MVVLMPPQSGTQVIIPTGVSVLVEHHDAAAGEGALAERNRGQFLADLGAGQTDDFTTLAGTYWDATGDGLDVDSPVYPQERHELALTCAPDSTLLTYPDPWPDGPGEISSKLFGSGHYPLEPLYHRTASTVTRSEHEGWILVTWSWPTLLTTRLSWDPGDESPYDPADPGGSQSRPLRQRERKW